MVGDQGRNSPAVIANLRGQIQNLRTELAQLRHLHQMTQQKLSKLAQKHRDFRASVEAYIQKVVSEMAINRVPVTTNLPFLNAHLNRAPGSYPDENIPIMLEMAQCGEGLWSLFVEHLGFPCWRTVQRWRSGIFSSKGLSRDALDGSTDNLRGLFLHYFGDNYQTRSLRVVLAVDAAGVSPNVVVHKNGRVDGFCDPDASLPIQEALHLRQSLDDLRRFITANKDNVLRDFFVVMACCLEGECGGLPILLYPKQNGAADPKFVATLVRVASNVRECGVDVVGLAFDGDAGYLKFVRSITSFFSVPDLTKTLWQQSMPQTLMFEDLLHLAKCVRYRFVCGSIVCPYPHSPHGVSNQEFANIGIVPWVLDASEIRRMDDFLPLMMFNADNVLRASELGMHNVVLALLPMTLALSAVMDQELTRMERLDYLATAWALFWCYKEAYTKIPPQHRCQTAGKAKGTNKAMQIYDVNTLDKGLALFYSLSRVIADPRPVHLGALGTHWLEHLFGNIRRLCAKNDTPGNFERCLLIIMLRKLFLPKQKISIQKKRLSDSGAILEKSEEISMTSLPLGSFIHEAGILLGLNPALFPQPTQSILMGSTRFAVRIGREEPSVLSVIKKVERKPDCGSSTASRICSAAGLTTRKRDIEASQV